MLKSRLLLLIVTALVIFGCQIASAECLDCHGGIATNWGKSTMSDDLECTDCHGSEHDRAENANLVQRATPAVCSECHDEQVIDEMTKNSIMRGALAHRFSSYVGAFHGAHEAAWDEGFLAISDDLIHTRDTMIMQKKLSMIKDKMGNHFLMSSGAFLLSILGLTD